MPPKLTLYYEFIFLCVCVYTYIYVYIIYKLENREIYYHPIMKKFIKTMLKLVHLDFADSSSESDGEGNGTPLQYSCLENPMAGGAW